MSWICPFTARTVEAPFDYRQAAAEYLAQHRPWEENPKARTAEEMAALRWRLFLQKNMRQDAKLKFFLGDGRWLNPFTGKWYANVPMVDGKIGDKTVDYLARRLAEDQAAQAGQMQPETDLAYIFGEEKRRFKAAKRAAEPEPSQRSKPREPTSLSSVKPRNASLRPRHGRQPQSGIQSSGRRQAVGARPATPSPGQGPQALSSDESPIPGYSIKKKIGQGGMGIVYLAEQESMRRQVALKILSRKKSKDADWADRFLREAQAAGSINHQNIVTVFDTGISANGGHMYMAMELMDGGDAAQAAKKTGGRLAERTVLLIGRAIASGLTALHKGGVVHRDIKPSNIFMMADGTAKLGDLGLAKVNAASESLEEHLTLTGMAVGTPSYMSPEQARGRQDVDGRSDLYSLGATMFTLLAGQPPFAGKALYTVLRQIINDPAPNVQLHNPAVTDLTATIIKRCLAKKPEDRFTDAKSLIAVINDALTAASDTNPAPLTGRVKRTVVERARTAPREGTLVMAENAESVALERKIESSDHHQAHAGTGHDPVSLLTSGGYDCGIYHAAVQERDRYLMRSWGARRVLTLVLHLPENADDIAAALDDILDRHVEQHPVGTKLIEILQGELQPLLGNRKVPLVAHSIDLANGTCEIANAGMPPPIILDIASLNILTSTGESDHPIEADWESDSLTSWSGTLQAGMTTLLYTDGFLGSQDAFGEAFGIKRLLAHCLLAAEQSAEGLSSSLGAALDRHIHAQARVDATLVCLQHPIIDPESDQQPAIS